MADNNTDNIEDLGSLLVGNLGAITSPEEGKDLESEKDARASREATTAMSKLLDAKMHVEGEIARLKADGVDIPPEILAQLGDIDAMMSEVAANPASAALLSSRIGVAFNGAAAVENEGDAGEFNSKKSAYYNSLSVEQQRAYDVMAQNNIGGFNEYSDESQKLFIQDMDAIMATNPELREQFEQAGRGRADSVISGADGDSGIRGEEIQKNLDALSEAKQAVANGLIPASQAEQLEQLIARAEKCTKNSETETYNFNEVWDQYKDKINNGIALTEAEASALNAQLAENVQAHEEILQKATSTALGRLSAEELQVLRETVAGPNGDPTSISNEDVMAYLDSQPGNAQAMDSAMAQMNDIIANDPNVTDMAGALKVMAQDPQYKDELLTIAIERSNKNREFQEFAADWQLFLEGVDGPQLQQLQQHLVTTGDKDMLIALVESKLGKEIDGNLKSAIDNMPPEALSKMMSDIQAGDLNSANALFDVAKVREKYNFGDQTFFADHDSAVNFMNNKDNLDALSRLAMTSGTQTDLLTSTQFDLTGVSKESKEKMGTMYESLMSFDTSQKGGGLKLNALGDNNTTPATKEQDSMGAMLEGVNLGSLGVSGGSHVKQPASGEEFERIASMPAQERAAISGVQF